MKIGSILENQNLEKRIAVTPELVKKYNSLGFEVNLIENYGSHLGIKDEQFKDMGVKISKDDTKKFINGVEFKYQESQRGCVKVYSDDNEFLGLGEVNKNFLKHKQLV